MHVHSLKNFPHLRNVDFVDPVRHQHEFDSQSFLVGNMLQGDYLATRSFGGTLHIVYRRIDSNFRCFSDFVEGKTEGL